MKLIVAFILGMVAMVCIQGKTADWVVLPLYAHHLDRGVYCNVLTHGIGVERTHGGNDRSQIAVFRNSNCDWSLEAVSCRLPLYLQSANVRLGACGGIVSGYNKSVLPAGGFVATYERKTWGVNLIFVPPLGDASPGVLWWQLKFPW